MSNRPGVRVVGPLAAFAPGFVEGLVASGYRPGTAADQLRLMVDVSRWLAEQGLGAGDLTVSVVERFATERRAAGRARYLSSRALRPLLGYLRELGVAPLAVPAAPLTPAEVLIGRYSLYLLERRGLALSTVRNYVGVARVFLDDRERDCGELALRELDGAAVSAFVLRESRRCSVGSAKCMVTRLRALLRFLHVDGEVEQDLAGAVPSVAGWRLASLVKALDARSVARLLTSCDRRTRVGRRDFAIVTLLSRLGLRAGELAALQLQDVDWRAGEMLVRGKGGRQERLPLPADVGETLARWLERGRPRRDFGIRVHARARALWRAVGGCCLADRAPRLPAGWVADRERALSAAHGRDRDAPRGRELDRGRSGAASPQPGCHLDLCEGRSVRARSGPHAVAGERGMSTLAEHVQNYLTIRRALGFKLVGEGVLLAEFVAFAEQAGQHTITTQFALEWARRPARWEPELSIAAAARGPCLRAVSARARSCLPDPAARAAPRRASIAPPHTSTVTRRSPR